MKFKYTPEMDAFLIKHTTMPRKELTELFNSEFGVNVNANQIKAHCLRIGAKTGRTGRLEKGQAAWNKGIKNSTGHSASRWKKGNVPHTARPVGYERINRDGHIEVKVEGQRQMVFKHRWVWEQHHGEIPEGMVVSFRNGIRTDCRIDNLILLTRAELARLNQSYIKHSTPETHESCILLAKIKDKTHKLGTQK